nr:hypothetical protein [Providencia rettgeri]
MQKTIKKKTNRYFNDVPTTRLIVTCEQSVIDMVDIHIRADRVTRGNRAEFVRQAIIEKLQRELWWFMQHYVRTREAANLWRFSDTLRMMIFGHVSKDS